MLDEATGHKIMRGAAYFIAIGMSLFFLYTGFFGSFVPLLQRSVASIFGFTLIFLFHPMSKKWSRKKTAPVDFIFIVLSLVAFGYVMINWVNIEERLTFVYPLTDFQMFVGIALILIILEGTRRTVGLPIVFVTIGMLLYTYFGAGLPGPLGHRGFTLWQIIEYVCFTYEGIWGIPLGVFSTFVFLFVLLGAFFHKAGVGDFFINLSCAIAGKSRGGPAKMAVFSSALFGTLSGTAVSNVYTTGAFTIPLMKKLGYKPHFAGAVEACASTGGQIMPPIMGAGAFIMAEFLGVPYLEVAKAALFPAILYFLAVLLMIHFEAVKTGLTGMKEAEIPKLGNVLKNAHLIIPLVVLLYLLARGYTLTHTATYAIVATVLVSLVRKKTKMNLRAILDALATGAKSSVMILPAVASSGIIIGCITLTGLAMNFAGIVTIYSMGIMFIALIIIMFVAIILGMGMPTTAAYIMAMALGLPALQTLGVPAFQAHMFIFYFACISLITPPVALAAYAGAHLAGSGMMRTAATATRLGIAAFIVPYMWMLDPSLLLMGELFNILRSIATALVGVVTLASCLQGWLFTKASMPERALLAMSALSLLSPEFRTDLIGLGLLGIVFLIQSFKYRKKNSLSPLPN